jgi:hypothetical protein
MALPAVIALLLLGVPGEMASDGRAEDTEARNVPLPGDARGPPATSGGVSRAVIVAAYPQTARGDVSVPRADGVARVTFSPNGDGIDEYALVLARAPVGSTAELVAAVDVRGFETVWHSPPLRTGADGSVAFAWNGATSGRALSDGSYDLFVCAPGETAPCGASRVIAHVRRLSISIPSPRSFAAGNVVPVDIESDARERFLGGIYANDRVRVQLARFVLHAGRNHLRLPRLAGGLYRLGVRDAAGDRRFVPLVVRGGSIARPPRGDALVIEPFLTWRAYNLVDANRDGHPDSWYADLQHHRTVPLLGPFEVPGQQRATCTSCLIGEVDYTYARGFITWLGRRARHARFVTDLEATTMPQAVIDRYAAVVLPGHIEYYEPPLWRLLRAYRDAGGRIASLSANAFYASVAVGHGTVRLIARPDRSSARSDFALLGSGYVFCCDHTGGSYQLAPGAALRAPWLFAGTGLRAGARFGSVRGEIDAITTASPAGTSELARVDAIAPDGGAVTGSMALLSTSGRGDVFTAGMTGFVANLRRAGPIRRMMTNLWRHLLASR